jgi:hypothetical protein
MMVFFHPAGNASVFELSVERLLFFSECFVCVDDVLAEAGIDVECIIKKSKNINFVLNVFLLIVIL